MKKSWQHWVSARLTLRQIAALVLCGLALFAVIFSFSKLVYPKSADTVPLEVAASKDDAPLKPTNVSVDAEKNNAASTEVVVHVTGAVKSPGVYTLKSGSRIHDAVEKAGPTDTADVNALNLAQKLSDGARIVVPEIGQSAPSTASAHVGAAPASSGGGTGKVSINTASETELQTVNGIGPAKAQAIIAYRQEHGGFQTLDELKNVSGIGEKTFEKLKEDITL